MYTLAASAQFEEIVKKSRFLAFTERCTSPGEALEFLQRVASRDATHNCWAYRVGTQYRFSDDGEPGGTAGRPILAAIDGQGVDQVVVVVTRFFGGIKLGAGGLVRAYGSAAASCLRLASKITIVPLARLSVQIPFEATGDLFALIGRTGAVCVKEHYSQAGLTADLEIPEDRTALLIAEITNVTRGRAVVTPLVIDG